MGALSNPKHEAFAQNIVAGLSQREAYLRAGYKANIRTAESGGSALMKMPKVSARIKEIQGRAAEETETTVSTVLAKLWAIANDAHAEKDFAAASISMERAAKVAGIWVEKTERKDEKLIRDISAEPPTNDEWEGRYSAH